MYWALIDKAIIETDKKKITCLWFHITLYILFSPLDFLSIVLLASRLVSAHIWTRRIEVMDEILLPAVRCVVIANDGIVCIFPFGRKQKV